MMVEKIYLSQALVIRSTSCLSVRRLNHQNHFNKFDSFFKIQKNHKNIKMEQPNDGRENISMS